MLNMFAWAANQVLGVFSHLTEEGSRITGATYTTVNATIPSRSSWPPSPPSLA